MYVNNNTTNVAHAHQHTSTRTLSRMPNHPVYSVHTHTTDHTLPICVRRPQTVTASFFIYIFTLCKMQLLPL
jgi:hypothetical protein